MRIIPPIALNDTNVTTSVAENDYAEWSAAATYATGDNVMIVSEHGTWRSAADANTGNDPLTTDNRVVQTGFKWVYLGKTNPWKMFDDRFVMSQTVAAEEITVHITPGRICDGLALFNVDAEEVTITIDDPAEGEVYTRTLSMVDDSCDDFYEYFFLPVRPIRTLVDIDLPPYPDAVITIIISAPGGTAKCGAVVIGSLIFIGITKFSPRIGHLSFGKKDRDDYGQAELIPGDTARRLEISISIKNDYVAYADYQLRLLDSVGAAFICDDVSAGFADCMNIYGFFRDFSTVIPGPLRSECSIEIEEFI